MDPVTIIGQTNARSRRVAFGVKQRDRLSHLYVIGKTGTGKSTLLSTMVGQDLKRGHGFCLIDPHGDLVERIHEDAPHHRWIRVDAPRGR